jgi:hypothetical protein
VLEPERAAVDETLRGAMDTMAAYHSSPGDDMAMTVPTAGVKQPGFLSALTLRAPRKVAGAAEHFRAITDRRFRVRACAPWVMRWTGLTDPGHACQSAPRAVWSIS